MKNISLYKFLLPLSVVMLVIGAAIFFSGYLPSSNLGSTAGMICGGLLFFGSVFFIISLIDSSISRKRALIAGQGTLPPQKSYTALKNIGIAIILTVLVFSAFLFYILSTMWR